MSSNLGWLFKLPLKLPYKWSDNNSYQGVIIVYQLLVNYDNSPANIRLVEDVLETPWKRFSSLPSEDVFKTSLRRFEDVFKTFCKNVFKTSCKNDFKKSSRCLQDDLKMSSRRFEDVFKTSSRHLQDVLQRHLQDIFKAYHQVKLFLLTRLRGVFNTFLRHSFPKRVIYRRIC